MKKGGAHINTHVLHAAVCHHNITQKIKEKMAKAASYKRQRWCRSNGASCSHQGSGRGWGLDTRLRVDCDSTRTCPEPTEGTAPTQYTYVLGITARSTLTLNATQQTNYRIRGTTKKTLESSDVHSQVNYLK